MEQRCVLGGDCGGVLAAAVVDENKEEGEEEEGQCGMMAGTLMRLGSTSKIQ